MSAEKSVEAPNGNGGAKDSKISSSSQASSASQTAAEFINDQLQLEADAREALPYAFDTCTQPLGALRQILFSCLTCNPPPADPSEPYTPAGVCYSCSIACHGEHNLVELFNKRNFICDCGTSRLPSSSPCTLRINAKTGSKGNVRSETPEPGNKYNHNFRNRFCGCGKVYDAFQEKGTMYQCVGLGPAEEGGCGEDWWHPSCIVGLGPDWQAEKEPVAPKVKGEDESEEKGTVAPANGQDLPGGEPDGDDAEPPPPPGFPNEDDFEAFICYKCVDANPWIKRYAGAEGFLPPVFKKTDIAGDNAIKAEEPSDASGQEPSSKKRKATDEDDEGPPSPKKHRNEDESTSHQEATKDGSAASRSCYFETLPPAKDAPMSLFLKEAFQTRFCRCPSCFPKLAKFPQLLEEEQSYEPPMSEDGDGEAGGSSAGTASLLDRGERALSNVDRVRAIEGVMVYNHLKEKVKDFLKPFADNGQPVGAEDIKKYFEQLRGDSEAMRKAGAELSGGGDSSGDGDNRREQSGY